MKLYENEERTPCSAKGKYVRYFINITREKRGNGTKKRYWLTEVKFPKPGPKTTEPKRRKIKITANIATKIITAEEEDWLEVCKSLFVR